MHGLCAASRGYPLRKLAYSEIRRSPSHHLKYDVRMGENHHPLRFADRIGDLAPAAGTDEIFLSVFQRLSPTESPDWIA
jgi:hypothetical protein